MRVLGPVQVVSTSGRVARSSQCEPAAAAVLGTEFAEDAVIDMVEIPERGFAGEPQEHTADVTARGYDDHCPPARRAGDAGRLRDKLSDLTIYQEAIWPRI